MLYFLTLIKQTTTNAHLQFSGRCTDVKYFTMFHSILVLSKCYAS